MILLDTSAILFWSQNRSLLSGPALRAINEADSIAISAISLWEVGWKLKIGKLRLPISAKEFHERLQKIDHVTFLPTTADIWLKTVDLDWDHRDPADRVIVATALQFECPLITSDQTIREFYSGSIW